MNEGEFKNLLRSDIRGGFLLCGVEEYMKRYYRNALREKLLAEPAFDSFNHIVLDAADGGVDKLSAALSTMPFMADIKLVELTGVNYDKLKPTEFDSLCETFASVDESINLLLVLASASELDAGSEKRPSKNAAKLAKSINVVNVGARTLAPLAEWTARHLDKRGISVTAEDCGYIVTRCGKNMEALANELDKLACYLLAAGKNRVTRADIDRVTIAVYEEEDFALSNAVQNHDIAALFDIIAEKRREKVEPVVLLAGITKVYTDMMNIALLESEGLTLSQIAKKLGINEYPVKLKSAAVRRHGRDNVAAWLDACVAAEFELKNSYRNYIPIEKLLCFLARSR